MSLLRLLPVCPVTGKGRLRISVLESGRSQRGRVARGVSGDAEGMELRVLQLESDLADERKRSVVCVCAAELLSCACRACGFM